jgi:hypothetical protein
VSSRGRLRLGHARVRCAVVLLCSVVCPRLVFRGLLLVVALLSVCCRPVGCSVLLVLWPVGDCVFVFLSLFSFVVSLSLFSFVRLVAPSWNTIGVAPSGCAEWHLRGP